MPSNDISYIVVTTDNVDEYGIYCLKDRKAPGYSAKMDWFKDRINGGLNIIIAEENESQKQLGFIEFIPSEFAWRPVKADNYFFIQCIGIFVKDAKNKKIGSTLIQLCEQQAKNENKTGVCTISSDGAWMANKNLFEKNGYLVGNRIDRFELMYKKFRIGIQTPEFRDWKKEQSKYSGWNLIFSDQCPWHYKSVTDLTLSATNYGIRLKVKKLSTPEEAQRAPSGFGTFSLIKDGKLLADHYISKTRFENILKKELG